VRSSKFEIVIDYRVYTAYVHIWTYSPLIPYGSCTLLLLLGIFMRIFASRLCADYARARVIYAGAGEARVARVTFAVG